MAYRITDIKNFVRTFKAGENVLIEHLVAIDDTYKRVKEPCEILAIHRNHVLLRTLYHKNSQFRFSLNYYDFYKGVCGDKDYIKDLSRDELKEYVIDNKPTAYMTGVAKKSKFCYEV